jgi:uncharacterized YigZ family protein
MKDTYKTLDAPSVGDYKDKGSKFMAYAIPLSIESDFTAFLEKIRKEHQKANHHCYAWRLGMDGMRFRANDDGEPSGTAGRPILGQIDSFGLTNVGIVVVRYFGGTLLGTSGLISAYRESAAEVLRNAVIIEKIIEDTITIRFGYDKMPDVMNALKRQQVTILSQNFDTQGEIVASIRQSETKQKILNIRAAILKKSLEETATLEHTEGVEIQIIT